MLQTKSTQQNGAQKSFCRENNLTIKVHVTECPPPFKFTHGPYFVDPMGPISPKPVMNTDGALVAFPPTLLQDGYV